MSRFRNLAAKAKNNIRKAVNPTPAEMRQKTAKLREKNRLKEDRVRALEESRKARLQAQRLREREAAARKPIPVKSSGRSGGKVKAGKVMTMFDSPLYGGSGRGVDFSQFGAINQDPFGGSKKSSGSKPSRDPLEFFYK